MYAYVHIAKLPFVYLCLYVFVYAYAHMSFAYLCGFLAICRDPARKAKTLFDVWWFFAELFAVVVNGLLPNVKLQRALTFMAEAGMLCARAYMLVL